MFKTKFIKNNRTYKTENGLFFPAKIIETHEVIDNIVNTYLPIEILKSDMYYCDMITPFLLKKHGFVKNKNGAWVKKHIAVGVEISVIHEGVAMRCIVYCGLVDYLDGSMQRFPRKINTMYDLNCLYRAVEGEDVFYYDRCL